MAHRDRHSRREQRRYRRAVRRAFAQVTFYREQCAAAGRMLAEPDPTPTTRLPQPPHTLCPFARPWSPEREPSLWTPTLRPLARVLRMAGARDGAPVLEVRDALLDYPRLPRRGLRPGEAYRVLLSPGAPVASPARRAELNQAALAAIGSAGAGWVVGAPEELSALAHALDERLRPVHRLPVATVVTGPTEATPAVLYEPMLGYLGARVPGCGHFHLDTPRVYARERDGLVTISLPRSRRPTLLDIVPPEAGSVVVSRCARHGAPVLAARHDSATAPPAPPTAARPGRRTVP